MRTPKSETQTISLIIIITEKRENAIYFIKKQWNWYYFWNDSEFKNNFANNADEKTNNVNDEPILSIKYTEIIQRKRTKENDRISRIYSTMYMLNFGAKRQTNILPPSKSFIGKRFNIARKNEATAPKMIYSLFWKLR